MARERGSRGARTILTPKVRAILFYAGLALLGLGASAFVGDVTGLIALPEDFIAGESALHSVARLAVIGCVLAAIGSWE